jgi:hypothetical protein
MKAKLTTQSPTQAMAAELRLEVARLEQEIKALLKAAEVLDKAGQKDAVGSIIKEQEELLHVKNAA